MLGLGEYERESSDDSSVEVVGHRGISTRPSVPLEGNAETVVLNREVALRLVDSSENACVYLEVIEGKLDKLDKLNKLSKLDKLDKLEKLENMLVTMRTDNLETRRLLLIIADQINMQMASSSLEKTEGQHTQGYTAEQLAERLARGEMVVKQVDDQVDDQVEEQVEDLSDSPYTCPPYSPVVHSPHDYGESNP
jgi:hypothetical protein